MSDIFWTFYHWVRENIFKKPPKYAGIPIKIEWKTSDGTWVELTTDVEIVVEND